MVVGKTHREEANNEENRKKGTGYFIGHKDVNRDSAYFLDWGSEKYALTFETRRRPQT